MEELLIILLQGLAEIALQVLLELPWDSTLGSGERRASSRDREPSSTRWVVGSIVAGLLLAALSLVFVPRVIVPVAGIRIANLFLAPLVSSVVAYRSAQSKLAKNRPWIQPDLHAWCAFLFTGAFTALRFMYAQR